MALRTIREMGDPVLEKKAKAIKEVTPRIRTLAEDMLETMYETGGVGLAAPQVGILKRIVVIDITEEQDEPLTMVNPEIIEQDGEQTGYEGCLSVPGKVGEVTRPNRVVVRYNDLDMNEWELEAEEFLARAICHELDHLDGHLYVEKVNGELRDASELQEAEDEGCLRRIQELRADITGGNILPCQSSRYGLCLGLAPRKDRDVGERVSCSGELRLPAHLADEGGEGIELLRGFVSRDGDMVEYILSGGRVCVR